MAEKVSPNADAIPLKVLLVEDDPAAIMLTLEGLRDPKVPYEVSTVHDGEQALRFLRKQEPFNQPPRPDIILLDLNLPRIDGRQFLAILRDDPTLTDIPVIVLTNSANADDVQEAYRLHASGYIIKPASLNDYFTALRSLKELWFKNITFLRGAGRAAESGSPGP
jgi:two-component system response regulator